MVRICVKCKKEESPLDNRSFHKFPSDENLRSKWMNILGVYSVSKRTLVCNDHFDENTCFHKNDGYSTRRRLLSDALPKLDPSRISELLHSTFSDHSYARSNETSISCSGNETVEKTTRQSTISNNAKNKGNSILKVLSVITLSPNEGLKTAFLNAPNSSTNTTKPVNPVVPSKSKQPLIVIDNDSSKRKKQLCNKKKIRFRHGFRTEYVAREDFVSEEAWERFLRFSFVKNQQLKAAHNKSFRKRKKNVTLESVIKNLTKKELLVEAQYLKNLPPQVQQLILRMAERNLEKSSTVLFPDYVKKCAKMLYCYSPAAYNLMRQNVVTYLPSEENLDKWTETEDDNK